MASRSFRYRDKTFKSVLKHWFGADCAFFPILGFRSRQRIIILERLSFGTVTTSIGLNKLIGPQAIAGALELGTSLRMMLMVAIVFPVVQAAIIVVNSSN